MKQRMFALLLCLLLAFPLAVGGQERAGVTDVLAGVLEFKAAQSGVKDAADWVTSKLPADMGVGGEWYTLALLQADGYDLSACRTALAAYLAQTTVRSATTRQKLALTLLALGSDHEFIGKTLEDSIGQQGLMSWVWGLHLLNNGCTSPVYGTDEIIQTLLSLRKADGGWAVTGNYADADATAMVLQALAPHREDAEVSASVEEAVRLLSEKQLESGGFASFGTENLESAAQAIIALCALGIDPAGDERFVKPGGSALDALLAYRLEDGSFAHTPGGEYSESATAQAFLALTAYQRLLAGEGSIYLLDGNQVKAEAKIAMGYQAIAAAVIVALALLACALCLLAGKRHPKNFLAIACIAAALIALVFVLDVQSAEDYYDGAGPKKDVAGTVTLEISCDAVAGQGEHIPADGVILAETVMPMAAGDTVYTILTDAARTYGLHMEASGANGLMYVHGIGNIYEFDFGELSGWVYLVNGESASVGCDQYVLRDGDRIQWHYTLSLGKDIE